MRGEGEAPTPPTVGLGRALGLPGPVHRRQRLRARATAGSCCWGQAVQRAHLTRPQRPRRDDERLLGARQRRGTASPSSWTRPERQQLVLRRVHGCSPPVCKRRKRRATAEAHKDSWRARWVNGWFDGGRTCDEKELQLGGNLGARNARMPRALKSALLKRPFGA